MSEAPWFISFKEKKLPATAAASEQGAWNLLHRTMPDLRKFSQRDLKSFGYAAKKERK